MARRKTRAQVAPVTWRDGVHLTGTPIWCDARRRRDVCFVSSASRSPFILERGSTNWQKPVRDSVQTFSGPTEVEIFVPTQGASIGYTTETGPNPHWKLYTGPFRLTGPVTIRAKAIRRLRPVRRPIISPFPPAPTALAPPAACSAWT